MVHALFKRWEASQDMLNWRAGLITSAIYNTIRDPKKHRQQFTPEDFMPERAKPKPKPMSVEATLRFFENLNRSLGGVDLRETAAA